MRPNPPSLRRIAARIIDPATGASTWALGSHRWDKNKGSLTRKAVVDINHHRSIILRGVWGGSHLYSIDRCPVLFIHIKRLRSKGREARMVYIIKYMPACRRSGW